VISLYSSHTSLFIELLIPPSFPRRSTKPLLLLLLPNSPDTLQPRTAPSHNSPLLNPLPLPPNSEIPRNLLNPRSRTLSIPTNSPAPLQLDDTHDNDSRIPNRRTSPRLLSTPPLLPLPFSPGLFSTLTTLYSKIIDFYSTPSKPSPPFIPPTNSRNPYNTSSILENESLFNPEQFVREFKESSFGSFESCSR